MTEAGKMLVAMALGAALAFLLGVMADHLGWTDKEPTELRIARQ